MCLGMSSEAWIHSPEGHSFPSRSALEFGEYFLVWTVILLFLLLYLSAEGIRVNKSKITDKLKLIVLSYTILVVEIRIQNLIKLESPKLVPIKLEYNIINERYNIIII